MCRDPVELSYLWCDCSCQNTKGGCWMCGRHMFPIIETLWWEDYVYVGMNLPRLLNSRSWAWPSNDEPAFVPPSYPETHKEALVHPCQKQARHKNVSWLTILQWHGLWTLDFNCHCCAWYKQRHGRGYDTDVGQIWSVLVQPLLLRGFVGRMNGTRWWCDLLEGVLLVQVPSFRKVTTWCPNVRPISTPIGDTLPHSYVN